MVDNVLVQGYIGGGDSSDDEAIHETTPLLSRVSSSASTDDKAAPWYQLHKPHHIAVVTCLGIFLWVLSGTLALVPITRLAEDILCRRHYQDLEPHQFSDVLGNGVDERDCKIPEVQSRMAFLFAFAFMLNGVVGLLVAFPFGVLADRARKPVYVLGAIGQSLNVGWSLLVFYCWQTLPIELVVAGAVFQLLGGGLLVATAVLFAMLSDVLPAESRSTWFFFFSLSAQIAGFMGLPVSSKLVETFSPWVPLTITLLIGPLNAMLMLLVPETLKLPAPELPKPSDTRGQGLRSRFQGFTRSARESLCLLRGRSVRLILLSLVVLALANQEFLGIFIQYYSLRFHRSLVEAGYVLSIRGGVVVLIMGIVLPLLTKTLTPERSGLSAYRRDLLLARGSALLLCIGFLVLAGPDVGFVVAGLIIVTTGSGMGALCRSLITNLIKPDQTSMVFTLISILETLVSLPAGPLFAWAFSAGMNLRGFLYGLPFLILAALGLLAAIALLFLRGEMEDDELEWQPQEDDTSRVH